MRAALSTVILALAGATSAFPTFPTDQIVDAAAAGCPFASKATKVKRADSASLPVFDPVKQKVDVSGDHVFIPPKANDKRGPCPALNSLSNHGYMPRSGVTSLLQAVEATNKVFGMGVDFGTVLSTYATIMTGDPLIQRWSIGDSPGGLVLPPLLSAPQGLSGSHNKYEGDASPGRGDAYLNNGDASTLNITFFKQLYDLQPEGQPANYDYDILIQHRHTRREASVGTNPYFFNGPISGLVVAAAHSLIPRLMSNHSAEFPEGVLDHNVLKSFFGVSGSSNNLTYTRGNERIPDNWYRRYDDHSIAAFFVDAVYAGAKHPELLSIGGNTGTVNSFVGVNPGDITGGVYNSVNLLQGNNLFCFGFQAAYQALPDVLKGILGNLAPALGLWTAKITPILGNLGCPELTQYDPTVLQAFPGSGGGAL